MASVRESGQRRELLSSYALDRTVLANERTFAAWIRTGLAALAAGIAIEEFVTGAMIGWAVNGIAVILILYSIIAFALAAWRSSHLGLRLRHSDVKSIPIAVLIGSSMLLIATSFLALLGLWFERAG